MEKFNYQLLCKTHAKDCQMNMIQVLSDQEEELLRALHWKPKMMMTMASLNVVGFISYQLITDMNSS